MKIISIGTKEMSNTTGRKIAEIVITLRKRGIGTRAVLVLKRRTGRRKTRNSILNHLVMI